ncbi:hypothetical protein HHO41_21625 [Bacillus sp. DNRA2]|uniref:hypothetical protein n=1 Tax=Bacillus sp. DNRA2 TaxID=2723053 RepID=UPI00145E046D|nr:hypothetical protein [Bacillus sp. DNRA2]NMD72825.1 hypothetical protein [Bacillus sp. DNRA2]
MLETVAFYLSLVMAILLFLRGYIEAINISNAEGSKVNGGTLIFCAIFALFFSKMTFIFY